MALNPSNVPENISAKKTLRLYIRATLAHKKLTVLSFLLPIGSTILAVASPFFASKIIAGIIQDTNAANYFWLFIGSVSIGVACSKIGVRACMEIQATVMHDLQIQAFSRLLSRSVSFFSNKIGGKLVSDVLDFSSSYSVLFIAAFIKGLGFIGTIIIGLTVLFVVSWHLALFVFFFLSSIATWTVLESKRRSKIRFKRLAATKKLTSHISDNLVNATTVKMFASEQKEIELANSYSSKLRDLRIRDWHRATASENNRNAAIYAMQAGLLLLFMYLAKNDPSMLASGIFAFTYTLTISGRFFELNTIIRQIEESFLNASPMTNILFEEPEISDIIGAKELLVTKGAVNFHNVTFGYSDTPEKDYVFTNLSLNIKPGEKIGLVGKSGGGKSTLTRLLLRFDDITDGTIMIDEQDVATVTQASLRSAIAYVPQEPLLFHRSIAENIRYAWPGATKENIKAAAAQAYALEFIEKLPHGFDTMVGERGVKLSGGQRQRIAIARAILKDAPILVLDEATSALDSESEQYIQKSLKNLMSNRTSIVIAHRLSTIQKLDRIIVIDNGTITEQGSHDELLAQNGDYAKLWRHQSGGFIEE